MRLTAGGIVLFVRLTPKSARDEILGIERHGGETVLKARVRALPEGGRANAALAALIAGWLHLPASRVEIVRGGQSRLKQVAISGDASDLSRLIGERLATGG